MAVSSVFITGRGVLLHRPRLALLGLLGWLHFEAFTIVAAGFFNDLVLLGLGVLGLGVLLGLGQLLGLVLFFITAAFSLR